MYCRTHEHLNYFGNWKAGLIIIVIKLIYVRVFHFPCHSLAQEPHICNQLRSAKMMCVIWQGVCSDRPKKIHCRCQVPYMNEQWCKAIKYRNNYGGNLPKIALRQITNSIKFSIINGPYYEGKQ